MPKIFTSKTQKKGLLGEDIAIKYLKNKNFKIIERNYTKPVGEIDIIAEKDTIIYFIEVKSAVTHETIKNVSRETITSKFNIKPEENFHKFKLEKMMRTINSYLLEKSVSYETDWKVALICVYLSKKKAFIDFIDKI